MDSVVEDTETAVYTVLVNQCQTTVVDITMDTMVVAILAWAMVDMVMLDMVAVMDMAVVWVMVPMADTIRVCSVVVWAAAAAAAAAAVAVEMDVMPMAVEGERSDKWKRVAMAESNRDILVNVVVCISKFYMNKTASRAC
jgi:hypothetical protein